MTSCIITNEHTHIKFACPHCGHSGEVVWKGNGPCRELMRLSGGFHVEDERLPDAKHVIVCNTCDEIDPPGLITSH